VTFVGEDGADGGGLRRNLLSMMIDHAKDVFYVDPDQVGIDQDELDELYFALSIFLGTDIFCIYFFIILISFSIFRYCCYPRKTIS
jgi:hypothetical protein